MKMYRVKNITSNLLTINGKADDELWSKAIGLKNFSSPWEDIDATKTEFKALWDKDYLFFCFLVSDSSIHINRTDNSFESINVSDRVELFFRENSKLNPYYCLEIDPTPRIMDFRAYPNKKFDFNWDWSKKDLEVKSEINDIGFTVEGKISLASLKALNLVNNGIIEAGIFRAKYYKVKDLTYDPIWLTWVDPETETPNFHISSSFGKLKLETF